MGVISKLICFAENKN